MTEYLGDDPKTDEEKHAWMRRRGYPSAVFIPPSYYARAERCGYIDMRPYVKTKPIPPPLAPNTKSRWPCHGMKRRGARCGEVHCLPGRGGKCTACGDGYGDLNS